MSGRNSQKLPTMKKKMIDSRLNCLSSNVVMSPNKKRIGFEAKLRRHDGRGWGACAAAPSAASASSATTYSGCCFSLSLSASEWSSVEHL